jgi:hypothetical protein
MPAFLRGALASYTQESMALDYGGKLLHGFLRVDLEGQRLIILDESLRLTEYLKLQAGETYTYIVSPYWTTRPQYHPLDELPQAVGRFEHNVWWEQPLWWGGIVRDLHWRLPIDLPVIASALEASKEWWLLETPVGEILYNPLADASARWTPRRIGRPRHLGADISVPIACYPSLKSSDQPPQPG